MNCDQQTNESDYYQDRDEFRADEQAAHSAAEATEQRFGDLVQSINAIFWEGDTKTFRFTFVSQRAEDILGYPVERWLQEPDFWVNLIHPDDRERTLGFGLTATHSGRDRDFEYRAVAADGHVVWLHNIVYIVRDRLGNPYQARGLMVDITQRKQAELALQQQQQRERLVTAIAQNIRQSLDLKEILNTTVVEVRQFLQTDRVLMLRFDPDRSRVVVVESVDDRWPSMLGRTILNPYAETSDRAYEQGHIQVMQDIYAEGLPERHINLLAQFQVRAKLAVPIQQGEKLWGLLIAHHCSGTRQWQQFEIDLLKQLATQVAIAIQQSQLYQQLQEANEKLQRLASCDRLTQLANRHRFDEYLDQEWRRLARDKAPLSLILCDIDFFKTYNDTYGHPVGDDCLLQVAKAIKRAVKRPADLVARYGGEEFAVVLPDTDTSGAVRVAEEIRAEVKALGIAHVNSQYVTLSSGVASTVPSLESSPATLIAAADKALYQAKDEGRDRIILGSIASGSQAG